MLFFRTSWTYLCTASDYLRPQHYVSSVLKQKIPEDLVHTAKTVLDFTWRMIRDERTELVMCSTVYLSCSNLVSDQHQGKLTDLELRGNIWNSSVLVEFSVVGKKNMVWRNSLPRNNSNEQESPPAWTQEAYRPPRSCSDSQSPDWNGGGGYPI